MVLGLILFNIFFNDLFLILNDTDISCYGDDNTLYKACDKVDTVVKILRMLAEKQFELFKVNQMKDNTDKCYLILSTGDSN